MRKFASLFCTLSVLAIVNAASSGKIGLFARLHQSDGSMAGTNYWRSAAAAIMADSFSSPIVSVRRTIEWDSQGVDVVVGSFRSAVSGPIALAASASMTPVISFGSTSPSLSDESTYPYFSRAVPSDSLLAGETVKVLKAMGWSRTAVLFINDAYGSGFAQTIAGHAPVQGISLVTSQGFMLGDDASLESALAAIKSSIAKVVVLIAFGDQLAKIAAMAEAQGLLGEGYVWIITGDPIDNAAIMDSADDVPQLIQRMTGWLSLVVDPLFGDTGDRFQQVFDAEPVENRNHSMLPISAQMLASSCDAFCAYNYDAVWTAAIAMSRTTSLSNHTELLDQIQNVKFEGASGFVQYDARGDRSADGMKILVQNFLPSSTDGASLIQEVKWEWNPTHKELIRRSETPTRWPGGEQTWTPPSDGFACPEGLVLQDDLICAPCPAFTRLQDGACEWFNASIGFMVRNHGISGEPLGDYTLRYGAAAMLAAHHINTRSSVLVPDAQKLIPPGFRFTFDMQDTVSTPTVGVTHTLKWGNEDVHAIVGAFRSAVSGPVSLAAATSNTPVISYASTSPSLSDKFSYPLFSRSVPSDTLAAEVTTKVVKELGWSRIAVLFINDAYGSGLAQDISLFAQQVGMVVAVSQGYTHGDHASMEQAMAVIKESRARVFVVVTLLVDFTPLTAIADAHGLLDPSYVWISAGDPASPAGLVEASPEPELTMRRMEGWLSVEIDPMYGENGRRLSAAFAEEDLENLDHPLLGLTRETLLGPCDAFCGYAYDAIWTTAIAISRTAVVNNALDKDALLDEMRDVTFVGASGAVSYSETGDRSGVGMNILVKNFVVDQGAGRRAQTLTQVVPWRWTAEEGLTRNSDTPPIWPGGYPASWTPPPDGSACPAGWIFSSDTLDCMACPPGTFQDEAVCSPCELGTYAPSQGMAVCLPCQDGFANQTGMSTCFPCPLNAARVPVSDGLRIEDCACVIGFFSADGPGTPCTPCPTGALCKGQSALPFPVEGFWGDVQCKQFGGDTDCPDFDMFLECNPAENCAGGAEFACEAGRDGPLCLKAQKGWTIVGGVFWFECGEYGHLNTLVGIGAVILVWFGINQVASGEYDALNVALLFVQITGLISTFGLKWHENLRVLNIALGVANFGLVPHTDVDFVTPLCLVDWTGTMAFYLQLLLPFIFGVMYALLSLLFELWTLRSAHAEDQAKPLKDQMREMMGRIGAQTLKSFLSFVLIVYHTLCLKCFSAFRCTSFPDGKLYNTFDPEVECWTGTHIGMATFASIYIPLILVGVPGAMMYQVRKHKRAGTLQRADVLWQWGFVHAAYENAFKWWEGMIILRRFCIALITAGMDEPMLQGAATIVVLTAFLTAHVVTSPYISASVDILDFASLCGSILYVLAGMLMYPSITVNAQGVLCAGDLVGGDKCRKDASVKEFLSVVSLCVILLTLCVCGVLTYWFVKEARRSKKAGKMIRKSIEVNVNLTSEDHPDARSSVNMVALEEMLEGNKLWRWVRTMQPSGAAVLPTNDDSISSNESYWMLDKQMQSLEEDLSQFAVSQRAVLMRHLCEIPGIIDYLCGDHEGGTKLLDFVESMASFSERQRSCDNPFPIYDLFNFQHRPMVTYWLMCSHPDDRERFLKVMDAIIVANGHERFHPHVSEYSFLLRGGIPHVPPGCQATGGLKYCRHMDMLAPLSSKFTVVQHGPPASGPPARVPVANLNHSSSRTIASESDTQCAAFVSTASHGQGPGSNLNSNKLWVTEPEDSEEEAGPGPVAVCEPEPAAEVHPFAAPEPDERASGSADSQDSALADEPCARTGLVVHHEA